MHRLPDLYALRISEFDAANNSDLTVWTAGNRLQSLQLLLNLHDNGKDELVATLIRDSNDAVFSRHFLSANLPSPKGCFHKNQPDRMREKRMAVPDPYENEQSCIHVFNKRNPKSTNCWNDRETLFHKKEAATINNEKPIRTPYENEQS